MMKISCLLLAAGSSTRMGSKNKLMLEVDGDSIVKRTFKEISKISFEEVVVVTGHEHERVEKVLSDLSPRFVFNTNYKSGMHGSIRTGVKALQNYCDAFFICLSDQPFFDHQVLQTLIDQFEKNKILTPVYGGQKGHPVLISSTFIPEILEEPDGDYGCAYLLKRYPKDVKHIPVTSQGILIDIDAPEDYDRVLNKSFAAQDPVEDFYAKTLELRQTNKSFVVASVIEVIGSASARVGSKAIFDDAGKNLLGWVGGGCAERFIGEESVKVISEGRPRTILADLDDEIFGLGVACGGKMKVFLDPILPSETFYLPDSEKFQNEIRTLSGFYGWNVKKDFSKVSPKTIQELLTLMCETVAKARGTTNDHLRIIKKVPATFSEHKLSSKNVAIVGRTRITEALARHFTLLQYNVRAIGPDLKSEDYPSNVKCQCLDDSYDSVEFFENEIVVIASHTSQDPALVKKAQEAKASYIGMIGSFKRSEEVLDYLKLKNQNVSFPLFIPAGLDIAAKNPDEIALSIFGEVINLGDGNI